MCRCQRRGTLVRSLLSAVLLAVVDGWESIATPGDIFYKCIHQDDAPSLYCEYLAIIRKHAQYGTAHIHQSTGDLPPTIDSFEDGQQYGAQKVFEQGWLKQFNSSAHGKHRTLSHCFCCYYAGVFAADLTHLFLLCCSGCNIPVESQGRAEV